MRLFRVNEKTVIETETNVYIWDKSEKHFINAPKNVEQQSNSYPVNVTYNQDYPKNKIKIYDGDLIEVEGGLDGELFTIIDNAMVNLWELFKVTHRTEEALNSYAISMSSERYYQPYKVYDLTKDDTDKIPAKKD